jgi:hypothetical protein
VIGALRTAFDQEHDESDRDRIQKGLDKAIVYHDRIEVSLQQDDDSDAGAASSPSTISIPFVPTLPLRRASYIRRHDEARWARRISLLTTVARSRHWIETILKHPALDFGAIGKHEKLAERHVRFLAPLAYLSPRIIQAIAAGRAPADVTVTQLTRNLPLPWTEQEEQLGLG